MSLRDKLVAGDGDPGELSVLRASLHRLDMCLAAGALHAMTADDVGLWMHDLGFGQLEFRVREFGASGLILMHLVADDLAEVIGSFSIASRILAHAYMCRWHLGPAPSFALPTRGVLAWTSHDVDVWLTANGFGSLVGRGWDGPCVASLSVARIRTGSAISLNDAARLLAAVKAEKERQVITEGAPTWTILWSGRIALYMLTPTRDYDGEIERIRKTMAVVERERGRPPEDAVCPLTRVAMEDPVIAQDGCTYERVALERFLAIGNRDSPETGESFRGSSIGQQNLAVKRMVEDWKSGK